MNKRVLFILVCLLSITSLTCNLIPYLVEQGLGEEGGSSSQVEPVSVEEIEAFLEEVDRSQAEDYSKDEDGDGVVDTIFLLYPREQLTEQVSLEKAIISKEESGEPDTYAVSYNEKLINTSDQPATIDHVLTIPKSLAENVSELTFTIPPSEIIEEDPVVKWNDLAIPPKEQILLQAKKKFQGSDQAERIANNMQLDVDLENCEKKEKFKSNKELCINEVLSRSLGKVRPERIEDICNSMQAGSPNQAVCFGVLKQDIYECLRISNYEKLLRTQEHNELDSCVWPLLIFLCEKSEDPQKCYILNNLRGGREFGCSLIKDYDYKNLCIARARKDLQFCNKIGNDKLFDYCKELLKMSEEEIREDLADGWLGIPEGVTLTLTEEDLDKPSEDYGSVRWKNAEEEMFRDVDCTQYDWYLETEVEKVDMTLNFDFEKNTVQGTVKGSGSCQPEGSCGKEGEHGASYFSANIPTTNLDFSEQIWDYGPFPYTVTGTVSRGQFCLVAQQGGPIDVFREGTKDFILDGIFYITLDDSYLELYLTLDEDDMYVDDISLDITLFSDSPKIVLPK